MNRSNNRQLLDTSRLPDGGTLVVACSGGGDSMALLHLVAAGAVGHRWRVLVAHLDHGLRDDSGEDAAFVERAAAELELPYSVESVRVDERRRPGESIEAASRRIRYAFLRRVAREAGRDARILTAHTADDQVETLALRLARGVGVRGLRGILPEREDGVVRPLLGTRRRELRRFLESSGIGWREDPTNRDLEIPRNRWRWALERLDPAAYDELIDLSRRVTDRAGRLYPLLGRQAAWWLRQRDRNGAAHGAHAGPEGLLAGEILLERPPGGVHFNWSDQALLDAALEAVGIDPRDVSRRVRQDLLRQLQGNEAAAANRGVLQLDGRTWSEAVASGLLMVKGSDPHWERVDEWRAALPLPPANGGAGVVVALPRGGALRVDAVPEQELEALRSGTPPGGAAAGRRAIVDASVAGSGLFVRYAREGDGMQPFGMKGRKLLSDLFGEAAVPRLRRGRLPVVVGGEEILWVAGLRASERGRVTPETKRALALVFKP